jgi:hypothetical protein
MLNDKETYNLTKKPYVDRIRNLLAEAMQESGHQFPMPEISARNIIFFEELQNAYSAFGIHEPGEGLSETFDEAIEGSPKDDNPFRAMRRGFMEYVDHFRKEA